MAKEITRDWQGKVILPGAVSLSTRPTSSGNYRETSVTVALAAFLTDSEAASALQRRYGSAHQPTYYEQRIGEISTSYDSQITITWQHYDSAEFPQPDGAPQRYCGPHVESFPLANIERANEFLRWLEKLAKAGDIRPHALVLALIKRGFILIRDDPRTIANEGSGSTWTEHFTVADVAGAENVKAIVATERAYWARETADREAEYARHRAERLAENARKDSQAS